MNSIGRFISNFKDFYNDINGATLTGAIDVIVVEQPDGGYNCSPFHVRFGKLGVLRSREKVVDIEINGEPQDIHMKLGESGEAFFVEELEDSEMNSIPEHLATSPITVSEFEKMFQSQGRRRSLDLGVDPIVTVENQTNDYKKRRNTADNENSKTYHERDFFKRQLKLGNIDRVENCDDLTISSTLSLPSTTKAPSSDDLTQDVSDTIFKMDSLEVEKTEEVPVDVGQESKTGKRRRRKTKKKNAPRKSSSNNQMQESSAGLEIPKDKSSDSITDRSSLDSTNSESEMSKAKLDDSSPNSSGRKVLDPEFHFFSDTELTAGSIDTRGTTPVLLESVQSDSEIEVKNRKEDTVATSPQSWEWGSFPKNQMVENVENQLISEEQKQSMISSMFSFMKTKHQETRNSDGAGVYLSDLSSGALDPDKAGLYFSPIKEKAPAADGDMDCESGNGPSLAQSPNSMEGSKSIDSDFDEQNKTRDMNDVSISTCGWDPEPTPDRFLEHVVSFSDLCNNPSLLEGPNVVFRIKEKYYNWKVAAPIIASVMIYHRQLPQSSVDQLCAIHMPIPSNQLDKNKEKAQEGRQYSWWNWRRGRSSRESTPALLPQESSSGVKPEEMRDEQRNEMPSNVPDAAYSLDAALQENQAEMVATSEALEDPQPPKPAVDKYRKTLRLSSKQISSLNLKDGVNEVEFSVTTAYQGTSRCKCYLYKWKWDDKIVISDIDGTITKSDVLGHILPVIGKDWAQNGVAQLFNKIADNGYKLLYLSARAIGQARTTREYLRSIRQGDLSMPDGPVLLNPTSLISAFHREVIEKKPEAFKISCMADIKTLFPVDSNPFYAGYGNRINDVWAYRAVGIPIVRIFTINPKGELKHELTQTFQSSYSNMSIIVDQLFPSRVEAANDFSQFVYWRDPISNLEELPEVL